MNIEILSYTQAHKKFKDYVDSFHSHKSCAAFIEISEQYLSDIYNDRRKMPDQMVEERLGCEKKFVRVTL